MYSLASSLVSNIQTLLGSSSLPFTLLSNQESTNAVSCKSRLAYGILGEENGSNRRKTCSSALWSGKFEIDSRTGFVPWSPPVTSLPFAFGRWEQALATATHQVSLADLDHEQSRLSSQKWRESLAEVSNPRFRNKPGSSVLRHHVLT
jgi:Indoleamine 2,3-dioxygenase